LRRVLHQLELRSRPDGNLDGDAQPAREILRSPSNKPNTSCARSKPKAAQTAMTLDNSPGANELEQTLLRLGGSRLVSPELPRWFSPRHAPAVWYGADRTQPMARGEAHRNVGVHYAQTRACDIGVGFALDDDGLWQSHAW